MDEASIVELDPSLFRPAIAGIVPYEPGKPIEEVQRELGLERVVKLASNEGPFPPLPAALEALARGASELNRYPDGSFFALRRKLAERHGVLPEHIAPAAGADGLILYLSLVSLDPGDEVVCGWPSFPSYVLDALKLGAVCHQVPLLDDRYDLNGLLAAVNARTKLVYICNPNNPTSTMVARRELDAYFARVPDHVLTVLDEAYFEYVEEDDYPNGIDEYLKTGHRVMVLRTFSKIYGLAGLRVGYGVGPRDLVAAIRKVQNAFDVTQAAQDAALASLDDGDEIERRRLVNREGRSTIAQGLTEFGLRVADRPVGNFVFADVGRDARGLFQSLLQEGVIVRPLGGFGAPTAIRVTVGTAEENAFLLDALGRLGGLK